jgi:RraA family protein
MGLITGSIGFRYIREISRPPKILIEHLREFAAANLADGMNKFYTMDYGIRQMFACRKMVGPAVTVKLRPGDNMMLHKAIELVQPGDVLVVDTQGSTSHAVMGELMVKAMAGLEVEGVVVDGTVRDVTELTEIGVPVFARGAVCGAGDKDGPGEINFPVACGGVVVNPGDVVFGDINGVVVIPAADIEVVMENARKKLAYEATRQEEIRKGVFIKPGLDEVLSSKGVK